MKNARMHSIGDRGVVVAVATALALFAVISLLPATAAAAPPPSLSQFCETGSAAGQCSIPRGIATNPATGNVYVADQANDRIEEFSAWGAFLKAWGWGVRDGSAELQTCGPEATPPSLTCHEERLRGPGTGQFDAPQGVAVDSSANIYVADFGNHRVQKFDSEGHFLLMLGGSVNKTKVEEVGATEAERNICTAASGDVCQAGTIGAGNGQFGAWPLGSLSASGSSGAIYVGDVERIQQFEADGTYVKSISLPGQAVQSLATDPAGNLYFSRQGKEDVLKLNAAGDALCTVKVKAPNALATDSASNLYVVDGKKEGDIEMEIRRFASTCAEDPSFAFHDGFDYSTGIATSSACGIDGTDLYVSNSFQERSYVRVYGSPPDATICPPPEIPPTISDQFVVSADSTSATLKAEINPRFWPDATYYVQYGVGKCSEGDCDQEQPISPGTALTGEAVSEDIAAGASLIGLTPETTYHYRFVAQSGGGGPVFGVGGEIGNDGAEGTVTTFPPPAEAKTDCANAAFRSGAGAWLPDCRAYEMVSPVDKNGGDVSSLESGFFGGLFGKAVPARIDQASPEGEAITYSSSRSFGAPQGAPWASQYISSRNSATGWSTRTINPPLSPNQFNHENAETETPFQGFSEDLCSAWVIQYTDRALAPGAPVGVPNLYRRSNCGAEGYELLTSAYPPGFPTSEEVLSTTSFYMPGVLGVTADGSHSFIKANAALTADATGPEKIFRIYETSEGGALRLLSVLPSGEAASTNSSVGTAVELANGNFRNGSVHNAVSSDGSRVFWTASDGIPGTKGGRIYLRANPLAEPSASGGCDEAGKACTIAVAATPNSAFWSANPAGSRVIYQSGGALFEAAIEEEGGALAVQPTPIAEGVVGVVGASEDATRVYFVSSKALAGAALAGKPNLYFHEQGAGLRFVGTLAGLDSTFSQFFSVDSISPSKRTARVSADGLRVAFMSRASLTGYDNTDLASGEPDAEVFIYDAGANEGVGELNCVSCNPSGARPSGRDIGNPTQGGPHYWIAAQIPLSQYQMHSSRALSEDGRRLFFESYDALIPTDTNGANDVYEWERALGKQQCDQMGAALYVKDAGGCLSLISSRESPEDSEFIDASADGRDVFFTTNASLVAEDPGLIDVYDAREGGGFAPKAQPPSCQGEVCQGASSAPNDPTPASAAFRGAGNARPAGKGRRCPKGKRQVRRAGKARCVKASKQKRRPKHQPKTRSARR